MNFDSEESCREHFASEEHDLVAIMAWIRVVARLNRGMARIKAGLETKSFDPANEKYLDNVMTL